MRARLERIALALAVAAILVAVGAQVAQRLARGESLPRASSLSAHPDGAAALAGALARLPGVAVERALAPGAADGCAEGCTLLVLGESPHRGVDAALLDEIDRRAREGARVVLAFEPLAEAESCGLCAPATPPAAGRPPQRGPAEERPAAPGWWRALEFARRPLPAGAPATAVPTVGGEPVPLASTLVISKWPGEAQLLARRDGDAVVALELPRGRGRLVLAVDDSPLLDRALKDRRATAWVAGLLGTPRRVVFEETHLGLEQSGGVMVLARRYRLLGVLAGLLGVALLYVWWARSPLAPARDDEPAPAEADGRSSFRGLVALLERGVPPARLLDSCVEAARTSVPAGDGASWEAWAQDARAAGDPVAGYQRIRAELARLGRRQR